MPEEFYEQFSRQKRHAAFSVVVFVLALCLLPLTLIAFRRYPLLAAMLLVACAALIAAWYLRSRRLPEVPDVYVVPILAGDPAACLVACDASRSAKMRRCCSRRTGGCARVLALECDDFDAQRMKAIRHRANQKLNQQYHLGQQISISDSYTQFRLNLVFAARDSCELRTWVSAQPVHLLQRAEPIVQAAIVREQGVLLFPVLHQWVTPAEAHVYETAAKLLTKLFLKQ